MSLILFASLNQANSLEEETTAKKDLFSNGFDVNLNAFLLESFV